MKKIYINKWIGFLTVMVIGIGATFLILHTVSGINAEYLSYVSE